MNYSSFIKEVCRRGVEAAKISYADSPMKLEGSLLGFAQAEHTTSATELKLLLEIAQQRTSQAFQNREEPYWFYRCCEAEVEWVCNVYSAILYNEGLPVIVEPTIRGVVQAAKILEGVDG